MTTPPEAEALEAALQALKHPPDTTHLPTLSRAVTRAADDLELVTEETPDRALRKSLLAQISHARKAVIAARTRARQAALSIDRTHLFESSQGSPNNETETDAARLAREINDTLRRTTAIVTEEIDRSRAAGNIVGESTRRLRMTRDQHGRYGHTLSSGAHTLKSIRRTEMLANALIIASFTIFFLAATFVTKQRIANSNISTFVLRPGMKVASIPVRIVAWMVRAISAVAEKGENSEVDGNKASSSVQQADEAMKAKEGREKTEAARKEQNSHNGENMEVVHADEDNETCRNQQECMSSDFSDSKPRNMQTAEMTVKRSYSGEESCKKPTSQQPQDLSMPANSDAKGYKSRSENRDIPGEKVGSDDVDVHENADPSAQLNDGHAVPDEETRSKDGIDSGETNGEETYGNHDRESKERIEGAEEEGEHYESGRGQERNTKSEP